MKASKKVKMLAASLLAGLMITGSASAADILCKTVANNHMLVDDSIVSACLDAGSGNLTGNPMNDLFINGVGAGYDFIEKYEKGSSFWTQNNGTGTFTFDDALWATYGDIAIAFKFGTGNQPDEWFVYSLQSLLSSGDLDWEFVNVFGKGGGLSHVNLYGILDERQVPEPGSLALVGLALIVMGGLRRRSTKAM